MTLENHQHQCYSWDVGCQETTFPSACTLAVEHGGSACVCECVSINLFYFI